MAESGSPYARASRRLRGWSAVVVALGAAYAIVGGCITLVGWIGDWRLLTDWRDDGVSMFINTAICAICCGEALVLQAGRPSQRALAAAKYLAGFASAIGALTLFEHLTDLNLGIDTLLGERPWGQAATLSPMRMGIPASTSFTVLGACLIAATTSPQARRFAAAIALLPLAIALLSLTGYSFGADQLYALPRTTGIAWQTSTMVAALGFATIAAIPEHGLIAALRRNDAGGAVLRRLIVPAVIAPFVLGWLQLYGREKEYYETNFGAALRTMCEILLLVALVWWTSNGMSRYSQAAKLAGARLTAIVESTTDAVVSTSIAGVIESWNYGAEQLFGYSVAEVLGKPIALLLPDAASDDDPDSLRRIGRGAVVSNVDTVRRRKDGSLVHVSLSASPLRNAAGAIVGASHIARDISERKEAEEIVRRSEAELRSLADSITQLAWMTDAAGNVVWLNRRWYEYTGTTHAEMEGWGWQQVMHADHLPAITEKWRHSLATGEPFEMEFPLRGVDGQFRWFLTRASAVHDPDGQITRWFGTNTNIDEAKRIQAQLLEETQTLELLQQTGMVVSSTTDMQQLIQGVTDVSRQLTGAQYGAFFYNVEGDDGEAFQLYTLSGAERADFEAFGMPRATPLFGSTFNGDGPVRCDDVLLDPRYGQWGPHHGMPVGHLPVRSHLAIPVISRSGQVLGGLFFAHQEPAVFTEKSERLVTGVAAQAAIALDNAGLIERLKKASDERQVLLEAERAARTTAERLNVMKDEFLSTLSHELRTPLTAILGWSQLLARGNNSPEDWAEGLATIERSARAQTQLIDDLLDMSRIISGKVSIQLQPTDLVDVVGQALASVRPSAEAKQLSLRANLAPHAIIALGDPTRLQQVFWNLLTNAVKFTPRGGEIEVSVAQVGSHVACTVRDTGVGIPPQFLPHVFDRFRQADSSITRRFGGLGLGLSIVKHLVDLHGGTVDVASKGENRGAAFTVQLPLSPLRRDLPPAPSPHGANGDGHAVDLADLKILVVDDDRDTRDFVSRVLRQRSAQVTSAADATEGLSLVTTFRPDVIISDIGMPGVDGYEFIRRVRALPAKSGGTTPAMSLTAFARAADRSQAIEAGYQQHVNKPIEPAALVATVRELADGRM